MSSFIPSVERERALEQGLLQHLLQQRGHHARLHGLGREEEPAEEEQQRGGHHGAADDALLVVDCVVGGVTGIVLSYHTSPGVRFYVQPTINKSAPRRGGR